MFWHKKNTTHLSLIIFGVIALGIISATAILVILLLKKPITEPVENVSRVKSSVEVRTNYQKGFEKLQSELQQETDKEKMVGIFEKAFFTLRVPQEVQEVHLSAWLKWLKIKPELLKEESQILREKMLEFISPIVSTSTYE